VRWPIAGRAPPTEKTFAASAKSRLFFRISHFECVAPDIAPAMQLSYDDFSQTRDTRA